jgi:hypothetical protein
MCESSGYHVGSLSIVEFQHRVGSLSEKHRVGYPQIRVSALCALVIHKSEKHRVGSLSIVEFQHF